MGLDLPHCFAAADVEVVDADRRLVLDRLDHGVGDRLIGPADRLGEEADTIGQLPGPVGGGVGHGGHDLQECGASVPRPGRVVEPAQPDGGGDRFRGREVERRQRHRPIEQVSAAPADL